MNTSVQFPPMKPVDNQQIIIPHRNKFRETHCKFMQEGGFVLMCHQVHIFSNFRNNIKGEGL